TSANKTELTYMSNIKSLLDSKAHVLYLFVFIAFCPAIFGQGSLQSAAAPGAPAGSYNLSDFESVNLFSGNLNFNLPLTGLKGRGDMSSGIWLTIEQQWSISEQTSSVWHIQNHIAPLISAVGHVRINGTMQQLADVCSQNPPAYWDQHR